MPVQAATGQTCRTGVRRRCSCICSYDLGLTEDLSCSLAAHTIQSPLEDWRTALTQSYAASSQIANPGLNLISLTAHAPQPLDEASSPPVLVKRDTDEPNHVLQCPISPTAQ